MLWLKGYIDANHVLHKEVRAWRARGPYTGERHKRRMELCRRQSPVWEDEFPKTQPPKEISAQVPLSLAKSVTKVDILLYSETTSG